MDVDRQFAANLDAERQQQLTYEYLCHLEEAKIWMEACTGQQLPSSVLEFEESLRTGVYLAKLGAFFAAAAVDAKKVYDADHAVYRQRGLQFRHTENAFAFIRALQHVRFPSVFQPETTDIYDKKNMPKVIYCVHALSLYLYNLGAAPLMQDLCGKLDFSDNDIGAMNRSLLESGVTMPNFKK